MKDVVCHVGRILIYVDLNRLLFGGQHHLLGFQVYLYVRLAGLRLAVASLDRWFLYIDIVHSVYL